jgi:hypothetical protein
LLVGADARIEIRRHRLDQKINRPGVARIPRSSAARERCDCENPGEQQRGRGASRGVSPVVLQSQPFERRLGLGALRAGGACTVFPRIAGCLAPVAEGTLFGRP